MKHRLIIILVMFIATVSAGCAAGTTETSSIELIKTYQDIPGVTEEEITAVEALKSGRTEFTYGVLLSTEAFVLLDGSYGGFTVKYCDFLSELFGIDFNLKFYEWNEMIMELEAGKLDFTGELTPTAERQQVYSMTSPIAERMLRIFMPADAQIDTIEDVNGLNIASLSGSITVDSIRQTYPVSFTRVDVEDYQMAAEMIRKGQADAFIDEAVADPAFWEYDDIRSMVFFPMIHEPVSMTTANSELTPVISIINKYIESGGFDKLYDLYKEGDFDYGIYKLHNSFTNEERAFVDDFQRQKAAIAVAFDSDNYPISFYNDKDGEYQGIAVDVLEEISKITGIEFKPAVTIGTSCSEIYDKLKTGEVRMAAQLLFSEQRKDQFLWSAEPFARSYLAIMSRSEQPNLAVYQVKRHSVGVLKQSGMADFYNDLFPGNSNLYEIETQTLCLEALEKGEVDLLMASEYMLLTESSYREKTGLKINIKLNTSLDSHFGFHKEEMVLCSIIDKAQQYVDTGIIETSWTGRHFDYSKKLTEQRNLYMMIFISILFIMLMVTMFLYVRKANLSKELKEMAYNDFLTNIFNRRFFLEMASFQVARSNRTGLDCFIVMFDLDFFKKVNDTYGHSAGDEVLREVARRVQKSIRPYDIFARYGGEEFIILMTDVKEINKDNAINAMERIRQVICNNPIEFEGRKIAISASFGMAHGAPQNDLNTAIEYADEALYQAKAEGRNRVVFYEENQA